MILLNTHLCSIIILSMSEEEAELPNTSLKMKHITLSYTFANYDGVVLIMEESNRKTTRQLKKRVFKELTNRDLISASNSKSGGIADDTVIITTPFSPSSNKSDIPVTAQLHGISFIIQADP